MHDERASSGWERWAGLAGLAFVALYVAAFALGIEVGDKDQEILSYYGSSSHRTKEMVAFFLISGAAFMLVILAAALRSLIVKREERPWSLSALAWAGGVMAATLVLAGNAVSRAPAFASLDDNFKLDPNRARLLNDLGFMLFAAATLAAILLVVAVSVATLRYGILPRWVGWFGFAIALLLPLGIAFVGYLFLVLWIVVVAVGLLLRRVPAVAPRPLHRSVSRLQTTFRTLAQGSRRPERKRSAAMRKGRRSYPGGAATDVTT